MNDPSLRLTKFARGGGCAAKLRLGQLTDVLEQSAEPTAAGVLVAHEFSDDAAVVQVTPGTALVMTTDVIAPLVDDPEIFGAIAATNAMSDVWAMGGQPRFALNLAFFDPAVLPIEVLHAIMRGGARACHNAGVAIVGGHTVCDPDIKYGLAVTGEVLPAEVLSNRGALPGQVLVLTKALGTGVICQAIKNGAASVEEINVAVASMTTANGGALAIARQHGVTALTDVTGFGLCGHLRNLLRGSNLSATVNLAELPLLPGALMHLAAGLLPGGSKGNYEFMLPFLRELPDEGTERARLVALACDAQTSGGLLLCLPAEQAADCTQALREAGLPAREVGTLVAPTSDRPAQSITLR